MERRAKWQSVVLGISRSWVKTLSRVSAAAGDLICTLVWIKENVMHFSYPKNQNSSLPSSFKNSLKTKGSKAISHSITLYMYKYLHGSNNSLPFFSLNKHRQCKTILGQSPISHYTSILYIGLCRDPTRYPTRSSPKMISIGFVLYRLCCNFIFFYISDISYLSLFNC